ncbi:MAG: glycosyltransferase family 2 protein [Anaerolineae bacterium]|nr:glycosyltransferase family 2 protein [Anaerolineae bacterium]MDW8099311.1 glycosyltransferase family 2 protein [Anaerolineae bacterium]
MERPYLSIVIPAYNEERRLPRTLERVFAYMKAKPYVTEVVVVDDGSTDGTASVVERMLPVYPNLRLIRNDHRGKAYTVRTGVLAARGHYVLFCDADLATPIEEWEKLAAHLEAGYDIAIGSREGAGAVRYDEPWYRHLMGRVFNLIVRIVAVGHFQDTQCGFKAFRYDVAQDLFRRVRLYADDAPRVKGAAVTGFDVELLFLAIKRGYRVKEVPVEWHYGTETKVHPLRDSLRNLRDTLMVRWNDLRGVYDSR